MSSRRTLILLAALAVGIVAAVLLYTYVKGIEDRANGQAKRVKVFYATNDIKRGTPGEDAVKNSDIQEGQIPQQFRPATAINSTDEVNKKVALFDIPANTVILQNMFVDPATTQISFRQRLRNPDHVAISFSADGVRAVGGFLVAGDDVNMMVFQTQASDTNQAGGNAEAGGGGNAQRPGGTQGAATITKKARMLYQKVQLLAVGSNAKLLPGESTASQSTASGSSSSSGSSGSSSSQNSNQSANVFTTNVPPEASLWIASAQEGGGGIYLSLVADDYKPRPITPIPDVITELPGENPDFLTPYGKEGNTDK